MTFLQTLLRVARQEQENVVLGTVQYSTTQSEF